MFFRALNSEIQGKPLLANPEMQLLVFDASPSCGFFQWNSLSAKRHEHGIAFIPVLFSICRPSAIARFIADLVVDALYRGAGWTLAHIRKEVLKFFPSCANRSPLAAVVAIVRVFAPIKHAAPRNVRGRRWFKAACMAMTPCPVSRKASAASCVSDNKGLRPDLASRAAIAFISPARSAPMVGDSYGYDQAAESFSRQFECFWHMGRIAQMEIR